MPRPPSADDTPHTYPKIAHFHTSRQVTNAYRARLSQPINEKFKDLPGSNPHSATNPCDSRHRTAACGPQNKQTYTRYLASSQPQGPTCSCCRSDSRGQTRWRSIGRARWACGGCGLCRIYSSIVSTSMSTVSTAMWEGTLRSWGMDDNYALQPSWVRVVFLGSAGPSSRRGPWAVWLSW